MSPTFLLPVLLVIVFFLFMILILGTSLFYIHDQLVLRRLFWEQQAQLTQLLDQLTILTLEETIEEKTKDSESPSTQIPGFPQHLQFTEPLDRKTLEYQFHTLKEQIINGAPANLHKLSDLLTQVEELLKESQETS